jgi:F-type H+-transporting ATPase subunit b
MRSLSIATLLLLASPTAVLAAAEGETNLLSPAGGLMFWTLLVFLVLIFILRRFARAEREEAARLREEHQRQLDAARGEAQRFIAEGRATAEKMKAEMLEATRLQQQELLERAKRDIDAEKSRAIAELRREAVDLAIAGASKVIEKNLDSGANRELVESFLSSIPAQPKR